MGISEESARAIVSIIGVGKDLARAILSLMGISEEVEERQKEPRALHMHKKGLWNKGNIS